MASLSLVGMTNFKFLFKEQSQWLAQTCFNLTDTNVYALLMPGWIGLCHVWMVNLQLLVTLPMRLKQTNIIVTQMKLSNIIYSKPK